MSFRATNGQTGAGERFADVSRVIDLPNAGFGIVGTCGDEPLLGNDLQVVVIGGVVRRMCGSPGPPRSTKRRVRPT